MSCATFNVRFKAALILLFWCFTATSLFSQNLQISGGNDFSVSLCSDGKVYAWGHNNAGQLGRDATNTPYFYSPLNRSATPQLVYLPVANSLTMKQVDAGSGNTGISLACDGSVWQWGGNCGNGNIGNGVTGASCSGTGVDGSDYYSAMQRVLKGAQTLNATAFLNNIVYINASTLSSFAVEGTGKVLAWGNNAQGVLGNGSVGNAGNTYTPSYVLTAAGTPLTGISVVEGTDYSGYALSTTGFVYSWGYNTNNDLGRTPTAADQNYAVRVKAWDYSKNDGSLVDLSNIVKMTGGDTHGLAIDANGNLWSWGGDWGPGQRGGGNCGCNNPPYATRVIDPSVCGGKDQWKIGPWLTGVKEVSAGQKHSIVLLNNGKVLTFGDNSSGQLGEGGLLTSSGCPVYVKINATTDLTNIVSVSDGDLWSFALTSSGQVYVWGENGNGELGIPGNTTNQKYAYLNPAIPTACSGSILPCPKADLGADVLKCSGTSVILLAGANGDTYQYTWYSGTTAAGPWTQIGATNRPYAAGAGATITVTNPLFYKVEITDTRLYVANQCGGCALSSDIMQISDRTPPLATTAGGSCGSTNVCFGLTSTGAIDNNAFDWYATQASVPKLNTSGTTNPFCTPKAGLVLNGSNYEIWVDDQRQFQSTVGPTTNPCAPTGGSSGNKYQQEFVVYQDITINSVDVFYKTYSVTAGFDAANVKVYSNDPNKNSSSTDGVNALTGLVSTTYTSIPRTSATFIPVTLTGLNLTLTGSAAGTKYWLEVSGLSNGEFGEYTCAATYPYADAVVGQTIVDLKGSTTSAQSIQQAAYNALAFNWKFTYQDGYPCGRFKVTAPSGTTSCLPVEFVYFRGDNHGRVNHLTWATATEEKSNYFEIERSYDGITWTVVGKVQAAGNSRSVIAYAFDDVVPQPGEVYYHIVETDVDGATTGSTIISIATDFIRTITISPNPNSGVFTIMSNGLVDEAATITVFDAVGKVVYQSAGRFAGESLTEKLVLTNLSKGLYFVTVSDGSFSDTQKLIIE